MKSVYEKAVKNAVNHLLPYSDHLRSSAPFWKKQRIELNAMVTELGQPMWFLTLRAADTLWPQLFRLLDADCDENTVTRMTPTRRQELLNEHPIVDLFWQHILNGKYKPLGRIVDYWWRIEFSRSRIPSCSFFVVASCR